MPILILAFIFSNLALARGVPGSGGDVDWEYIDTDGDGEADIRVATGTTLHLKSKMTEDLETGTLEVEYDYDKNGIYESTVTYDFENDVVIRTSDPDQDGNISEKTFDYDTEGCERKVCLYDEDDDGTWDKATKSTPRWEDGPYEVVETIYYDDEGNPIR